MKNSKKILAIIPARGGSKGIPRKNIRLLAGRPLIVHTIEQALKSKYLDKVIVSTDDQEIEEISKKYRAKVVKRPEELAEDSTLMLPVMEHVVSYLENNENYKPDIIVLLQPTSPFRQVQHIDEAIDKFLKENYDSLLSVCPFHEFIWRKKRNTAFSINYDFKKRVNKQDKEPEYRENGAIYISKYDVLIKRHNLLDNEVGLYIMPEENSVNIDTEFDFWLCEQILTKEKKIYEN